MPPTPRSAGRSLPMFARAVFENSTRILRAARTASPSMGTNDHAGASASMIVATCERMSCCARPRDDSPVGQLARTTSSGTDMTSGHRRALRFHPRHTSRSGCPFLNVAQRRADALDGVDLLHQRRDGGPGHSRGRFAISRSSSTRHDGQRRPSARSSREIADALLLQRRHRRVPSFRCRRGTDEVGDPSQAQRRGVRDPA